MNEQNTIHTENSVLNFPEEFFFEGYEPKKKKKKGQKKLKKENKKLKKALKKEKKLRKKHDELLASAKHGSQQREWWQEAVIQSLPQAFSLAEAAIGAKRDQKSERKS